MLTEQQRAGTIRLLAEMRGLIAGLEKELGACPVVFSPCLSAEEPRREPRVTEPARLATSLYKERRHRDRFFDPVLFADPAWDLLLDLYVAQAEGRRVCVSSACIAAAVPPTTGLRWIARLEESGLLERKADRRDNRRTYVSLTADAMVRLTTYLLEVSAE